MAMLISLLFKTLDEMDDDKEAKVTAAKPKVDEELDEDPIIRMSMKIHLHIWEQSVL